MGFIPKNSLAVSICLLSFLALSVFAQERQSSSLFEREIPRLMGLIQKQEYEKALKDLEPLRKRHPENPQLMLLEVGALEGLGRHDPCQTLAREYLEKFPDSRNRDQAWYLLGSSLLKQGKRAEARQALQNGLEETSDPSYRQTVQNLLQKNIPSLMSSSEGLSLGGQPPANMEERRAAYKIAVRILERALQDYRENREGYPPTLDHLTQGDPPILQSLPLNPFDPEKGFGYRVEDDRYSLSDPPSQQREKAGGP